MPATTIQRIPVRAATDPPGRDGDCPVSLGHGGRRSKPRFYRISIGNRALSVQREQKIVISNGRQNRPPTSTQPNAPKPIPFAESPQNNFVSILQKFPLLPGLKRNWILAPRSQLQQASARRCVRVRN